MKAKSKLALLILVLLISSCTKKQDAPKDYDEKTEYKEVEFLISAEELERKLGNENLVILDFQKENAYKNSHIVGAVNVDFWVFSDVSGEIGDENWGTLVGRDELKKRLKRLGIDDKTELVMYSDLSSGPGADGRALWQLRRAGFKNAKILIGGIKYWQKLKLATENVENKAKEGAGDIKLNNKYSSANSCNMDFVYENLGKLKIVDVRTKGEFKGSQNAGEPRGGHIKGAINFDWREFFYSDGRIKKKTEILEIMENLDIKFTDDFVLY